MRRVSLPIGFLNAPGAPPLRKDRAGMGYPRMSGYDTKKKIEIKRRVRHPPIKEMTLPTLDPPTIKQILIYIFGIPLTIYLMNQVRKPTKWVGRIFISIMNLSHSGVTDWGLKHVQIGEDLTILDVGCGGGRTIQKLAALASKGKVCGVDYANGSVTASRARNVNLIDAGRVEIKQASVSQIPYPDNTFDLVTAVETQYYWPDMIKDMQEILRVLKPGGKLLIIAESYGGGKFDWLQAPVLKLLRSKNPGVDEQREYFSQAGYSDIQIDEELSQSWLSAVGKKP